MQRPSHLRDRSVIWRSLCEQRLQRSAQGSPLGRPAATALLLLAQARQVQKICSSKVLSAVQRSSNASCAASSPCLVARSNSCGEEYDKDLFLGRP